MRNPRRTAATAAAMTIGVALVTGVTRLRVVPERVRRQGRRRGELPRRVLRLRPVPSACRPSCWPRSASVPGVGAHGDPGPVPACSSTAAGESLGGLGGAWPDVYPLKRVAGTVEHHRARNGDGRQRHGDRRTSGAVGTKLSTTFPDGTRKAFTIAGIYGKTIFVQGLQANLDEASKAAGVKGVDERVRHPRAGRRHEGRPLGARGGHGRQPAARPSRTPTDLKDQIGGFINQLLYVVYGLLVLSIVIAVLGVINTMAMAVLERTREIGLLRAIGLTRRQSRRMIRRESVLIALLGALLGVVAGLARRRGPAAVHEGERGIDKLAVPFTSIVDLLRARRRRRRDRGAGARPAGLADGRPAGDRHRVTHREGALRRCARRG